MNEALRADPAFGELRQLIAQLSLVSHVSGTSYDAKMAKASDEDIGGGRPPGSEIDRPRRPGPEPPDSDGKEREAWEHRVDEWEAWLVSYQRRTPTYFRHELERCSSSWRLAALVDEARSSLEAWRRQPFPAGGEPASMADPQWKRWVAGTGWSVKEIVNRYGCSRQYVHQVRNAYRADEAA